MDLKYKKNNYYNQDDSKGLVNFELSYYIFNVYFILKN